MRILRVLVSVTKIMVIVRILMTLAPAIMIAGGIKNTVAIVCEIVILTSYK